MARELWISKATGKRRHGTTWVEINELLETGITIESIYEPLRSCGKDWPQEEVHAVLERLSFDVVGVTEAQGGRAIGFIKRSDLCHGSLDECLQLFRPRDLIAYTAPLADALVALRARERVFVLGRNGVDGILTRADLNKPIARMYLFSLISLLEIHLGAWIQRIYRDDSWREELSKRRIANAEKHQQQRRERNQELELLECLQFCDKAQLADRSDGIRSHLGITSRRPFQRLMKRAEDLRNNLAHSQSDLSDNTDWETVLSDASEIERILQYSDRSLEKMPSLS